MGSVLSTMTKTASVTTLTIALASSTHAESATDPEASTNVGARTFPKGTATATEANLTR